MINSYLKISISLTTFLFLNLSFNLFPKVDLSEPLGPQI
jgi:hypothetical protein